MRPMNPIPTSPILTIRVYPLFSSVFDFAWLPPVPRFPPYTGYSLRRSLRGFWGVVRVPSRLQAVILFLSVGLRQRPGSMSKRRSRRRKVLTAAWKNERVGGDEPLCPIPGAGLQPDPSVTAGLVLPARVPAVHSRRPPFLLLHLPGFDGEVPAAVGTGQVSDRPATEGLPLHRPPDRPDRRCDGRTGRWRDHFPCDSPRLRHPVA